MAKLLNIDELTTSEKAIKIAGKEHKVVERSVALVLNAMRADEEMKNASEAEYMEKFVEMIQQSIPTVSTETLMQLPMTTLNTIFAFINEADSIEESATEEGEQGK